MPALRRLWSARSRAADMDQSARPGCRDTGVPAEIMENRNVRVGDDGHALHLTDDLL